MTIQETLRSDARWLTTSGLVTAPEAMLAAADRIDALEAALTRIVENSACSMSRHVAREALRAAAKEAGS